ncbi:tRNA 2'-phosphotransferase [Collariella sp. IMI 366227]|nr:tRNA 2'-phosphotransferase [Collariella sp. IMI 366227]
MEPTTNQPAAGADLAAQFEEMDVAAPGERQSGSRREEELSKALSKLLRHQAESAGLVLDKEGFARLDGVILHAVRSSDKQRFALKPNPATNPLLDESSTDPSHWLIRANQGHSIKLDSEHLLKPRPPSLQPRRTPADGTSPSPAVIHGTYFAFWPSIIASGGLKPMGRNHVHCSIGLPEDAAAGVVSGMRRDAELLIYVDVERSLREGSGIKWWMSDNGVVLTEGAPGDGLVPLKYFKEVVGRKQGVGVLWKDGEWVADLPEGLKIVVPQGRGGRGWWWGGVAEGKGRGR